MTQNTYYVSWHTWREDAVDTPWDFWYVSKGQMPRAKDDHDVDLAHIQQIWANQDVKAWHALQNDHVWDIKLAAFVQADHVVDAQAQVTQLFPDAVWAKCVQVDEATKQQIIQLFGDTLSKAA